MYIKEEKKNMSFVLRRLLGHMKSNSSLLIVLSKILGALKALVWNKKNSKKNKFVGLVVVVVAIAVVVVVDFNVF